jgi:hypothetical protein
MELSKNPPRVVYSKPKDKWLVRQRIDGKLKQLGSFETEADAWSSFGHRLSTYNGSGSELKEEGGFLAEPSTFPKEDNKEEEVWEVRICKKVQELLMEPELSETVRQQAIYLLSLLPEDGTSRSLQSDILTKNLPSRVKVYKFLIPKYVTRGKSYCPNDKSKKWRYTKTPTEFTSCHITDKKLLDRLSNWEEDRDRRRLKDSNTSVGVDWFLESLDRVTVGLFAEEMLARKEIVIKPSVPRVGNQGRVTHQYSSLPSEIRLNLLLDVGEVADVDMAKSQMCVIAAKFAKGEERHRFQQLIADGLIYNRLEFAMEQDAVKIAKFNDRKKDGKPKKEKEKIRTTKQLLNKVFMGHPSCDWASSKQMEREFPNLMGSIRGFKWKTRANLIARGDSVKDANRGMGSVFASLLQGEEAVILAKVAEKLAPFDVPCVPIYDGMLVPKQEAELARGFFEEVLFERLGFVASPVITFAGDETFHGMCAGF